MSLFDPPPPAADTPLSVSEVVDMLRDAVEVAFPQVTVSGEISRPLRAASGHLYLTLKDANCVLPAVMWRSQASRLLFDPADGMRVVGNGKLTVYGPRGSYQMVLSRLEQEDGIGALALAFERTKEKLRAEGLMDEALKRPLPFRPRRVALITSPTGAVVHDLADTILRRCARIQLLVVPVRVQGQGAAAEIAAAVARVSSESLADVAVVGRGGGSLEDLWAFNEEVLARAVAASAIPIISAVGHETDYTICDMVADLRAKTPTEAGFFVVPDLREELQMLRGKRRDLVRAIRRPVEHYRTRLEGIRRSAAMAGPVHVLGLARDRTRQLGDRNLRAIRELVSRKRDALAATVAHLQAVSPMAVLERGYSITRRPDGSVVRATRDVMAGDELVTVLASGTIDSKVQSASPGDPANA